MSKAEVYFFGQIDGIFVEVFLEYRKNWNFYPEIKQIKHKFVI